MSCLLKFSWVKLPRETLPEGKGLMGSWVRLAAQAAFRPGQANYCGYRNDVELASWVGGIVGLKSILGIGNRQKALGAMDALAELGYISFTLDKATKKLSYTIKDWVVECSGAACADGAVYATDGYGFLCLPRNITQRLAEAQYTFEESDRGWISGATRCGGIRTTRFHIWLPRSSSGARARRLPWKHSAPAGAGKRRRCGGSSKSMGMSSRCASCPVPMVV